MRIGIIGLGRIGTMHARNLAQNPNVEQVILIGRDQGRLESAFELVKAALKPGAPVELAGEFPRDTTPAEVRVTTYLDEALHCLDGLVIATTTESHPDLVRRAVNIGLPTLVEKPIALEPAEIVELAEELDAYDTPVMVAFQRRYDAGYQRLRQHVLDGDVGTLRLVRANGHDHHPLNLDYIPVSGGVWRDLMVHDFDIIPWVTGERVVRVHAVGTVLDEPTYERYGDADTAVALLTLESGAFATVSGIRHNGAGHDVRLEIFGTKNTFSVGLDAKTPVISTEPGMAEPSSTHDDLFNRFESAFRNEVDHFTKVIRGEAENLTPPREGLAAIGPALAAEESCRTGKPVDLVT